MNFETAINTIQTLTDGEWMNVEKRVLTSVKESGSKAAKAIASEILSNSFSDNTVSFTWALADSWLCGADCNGNIYGFSKASWIAFAKALVKSTTAIMEDIEQQKIEDERKEIKAARKAANEAKHQSQLDQVFVAVKSTVFAPMITKAIGRAVDGQPKNILFAIEVETGLSIESLLDACTKDVRIVDGALVCGGCSCVLDECECDSTTQDNEPTENQKDMIKSYLETHGKLTGVFFIKYLGGSMCGCDGELTEFALNVFKYVNELKREENKNALAVIERKSSSALDEVAKQLKLANQSVRKSVNQQRASTIGKIKYELTEGKLTLSLIGSTMAQPSKFIRAYIKELGLPFLGKSLGDGVVEFGVEQTQHIIDQLFQSPVTQLSDSIAKSMMCCASLGLVRDGIGFAQVSVCDCVPVDDIGYIPTEKH